MRDLRFTSAQKDWVAGKLGPSDVESFWPADDPANALWNEMVAEGITPADYVDPRTLQQIYDEEVLASLDRQVLKDAARMVEDFYDALVDQLPQSMKDKHGPLMAERKTKRAARP
jgi:Asp-tRNA(Asn)/Glu-tRNA(Gln) amidotransferase B subunit